MNKERDVVCPSTSLGQGRWISSVCQECRNSCQSKNVLRLVIKNFVHSIFVIIIRLIITKGIIEEKPPRVTRFQRISQNSVSMYPPGSESEGDESESSWQTFEGLGATGEEDKSKYCMKKQHDSLLSCFKPQPEPDEAESGQAEGDIVLSFIRRLAEALRLKVDEINQTVDNILTTVHVVLIDLNMTKLLSVSKMGEQRVLDIINDIFWRPCKRDCVQCEIMEGQVDEMLLLNCIHTIECSYKRVMSWHTPAYFYDQDVYPRRGSYAKFLELLRKNQIKNSLVTVIDENPLRCINHAAYAVPSDFQTDNKYLRDYMNEIDILGNAIVRLRPEIPYVLRTQHPRTNKHIFHLIYKNKLHDRPTYEDLYNVLVLLRDLMHRMKVDNIVMAKIGGRHDYFKPEKVLKMIKFIFTDSHLRICIGSCKDR